MTDLPLAPTTGNCYLFASVYIAMKLNYPPGYNVFTSIPRTLKQVRRPIGTMEESMERFNGTYSVHLGPTKFIVTQDPEFIEHVLKTNHRNYQKSPFQTEKLAKFLGKGLLTSNGEFWLKQRRLIQPGFHHERLNDLYRIMEQTIARYLDGVKEGVQDVYPQMNGLAFEIVINTLFNVEIPAATRRELSEFISEAQAYIIKDIRQFYKSWWFKLTGEEKRNLVRSQRVREIVRNLIVERKSQHKRFNDLLDMLLDARYEDNGQPMETEQMIDEILVLIIAGHETTANALSWTLYLLSRNQSVIERIQAETSALAAPGAISNELLNSIIKESMRLYPPAWISDRMPLETDEFKGYRFDTSTIVVLFYYGLHRNAAHWENPLAFDPDRFSKTRFTREQAKAYQPFGGGPRLCIGNNFAMAEMTLFLHGFFKRFTVLPTAQEPKMIPLITLKADQVILNVQKAKPL